MQETSIPGRPVQAKRQSICVFNGGFLTQKRVRRILELSGYDIRIGAPSDGDMVGVWGKSPTSPRGEKVAKWRDTPILRVEDALLRSVLPGRSGSDPIGLLIDRKGVHFDPTAPSDLEELLTTHTLDQTPLLNRARHAIERIKDAHLSKYNAFDPGAPVPDPGFVLVLDQTRDDASVTHGGADANTFREMLVAAQLEHPDADILIKTHPETLAGHRKGYFDDRHNGGRVRLFTDPVSPWALMSHARAVYTVSSGMGFEAIFADHKPRVFGQPFYAGWGLTQDEFPVQRRQRNLTRAQLFAAAMILYPKWYDPHRDQLCELEDVITALEAKTRAWREDRNGYVAMGMRMWKRAPLQRFYGGQRRLRFEDHPTRAALFARKEERRLMCWAGKLDQRIEAAVKPTPVLRIEDGFLRSRGLGAELVPPLSLVADDLGIYYDPSRESRLERLIAGRARLPSGLRQRARALIQSLTAERISKYNLDRTAPLPELPAGHRILVVGQVEDDASIRLGAGDICTNLALLKKARADNPDAVLLFKPHPDVEAGLRLGRIDREAALKLADLVLDHADPIALIDAVDEVMTMTSLLGFEALLRGTPVTVTGAPFYAGWGLTRDLGILPPRRRSKVSLEGLVHAALIDYPRYVDPVTKTPCPVEVAVERLANGDIPPSGTTNRVLSKLQGLLAGFAPFWRRW